VNAVDLAWKLMIGPAHIGGFRRATASPEGMLKAIRATLHMLTGNVAEHVQLALQGKPPGP
jgi:hypothetical protein